MRNGNRCFLHPICPIRGLVGQRKLNDSNLLLTSPDAPTVRLLCEICKELFYSISKIIPFCLNLVQKSMKEIEIIRLKSNKISTIGTLLVDGVPKLFTLENPWLDNERMVSCIPFGWYTARRHQSPRFGETFIVESVPGRSHILFHAGNVAKHTLGCILLGREMGVLSGEDAVLRSRAAFKQFMRELKGINTFRLKIREV